LFFFHRDFDLSNFFYFFCSFFSLLSLIHLLIFSVLDMCLCGLFIGLFTCSQFSFSLIVFFIILSLLLHHSSFALYLFVILFTSVLHFVLFSLFSVSFYCFQFFSWFIPHLFLFLLHFFLDLSLFVLLIFFYFTCSHSRLIQATTSGRILSKFNLIYIWFPLSNLSVLTND
jgi:hypothetical protein